MIQSMTFRNSKIIYFGPFNCERCGILICRMGEEFGGSAFTYPEGPVYPNTEWHVHVCDPQNVQLYRLDLAKKAIIKKYPNAYCGSFQGGYAIFEDSDKLKFPHEIPIHDGNSCWYVEDSAWIGTAVDLGLLPKSKM